jgi:hypothetical protein
MNLPKPRGRSGYFGQEGQSVQTMTDIGALKKIADELAAGQRARNGEVRPAMYNRSNQGPSIATLVKEINRAQELLREIAKG